jgi:hypothetical protein
MTWEFNRLVIYTPVLARELAGTANKSAALIFKDAVPATSLANGLITSEQQYKTVAESLLKPQVATGELLLTAVEDYGF